VVVRWKVSIANNAGNLYSCLLRVYLHFAAKSYRVFFKRSTLTETQFVIRDHLSALGEEVRIF